jgi:hypothetical protein
VRQPEPITWDETWPSDKPPPAPAVADEDGSGLVAH